MSAIRKLGNTLVSRALRARTLHLGILTVGAYLLLTTTPAFAACTGNNQAAGSVTFSPPATIQLPANISMGAVLWQGTPQIPSNPVVLSSCGNNTQTGLENAKWGPPIGTDPTLFPTNYPWLSYRILHPDTGTELKSWPNYPVSAPRGTTFNVASILQLVVTGTIPSGTHNLAGGQLTQWDVDVGNGKKQTVEKFNITTSTITLVPPTCAITTDPTVVTLPPVTVASLNNGTYQATAGQVPFNLHLVCTTNAQLSITLSSNDEDGDPGVIDSTGTAQSMGVQLLDSSKNPVPFDTAMAEGTTTIGQNNFKFYAQYYVIFWAQYGYPVTPGTVTATATYTLTYP